MAARPLDGGPGGWLGLPGGGTIEVFEYPGVGHLFTDPTLPAEYDPVATETSWNRVLLFVRACG